MRIPRMTRIILVPDNEQGAREYSLSRRLALTLLLIGILVIAAVAVLLASFVSRQNALARMHRLEKELEEANARVAMVGDLQQELDASRRLQEKLLRMLGVTELPEGAADSLGTLSAAEPVPGGSGGSVRSVLQAAATQALPPEPGLWPAAGRVTREFEKGNPVQGIRPHQGIDIAGPLDTPVLAVAPGTVTRAGADDYLGNYVEIQHGLGYLTVYGHLARAAVKAGDRVQGGQVIAYMGKSGQASATHLHFEIWRDGEPVDPRRYLSGEPPPQ